MSNTPDSEISIVVADDHSLFRKGLINLIHQIDPGFKVIAEAGNGKEVLQHLKSGMKPDVVVIDVNMPVMDGFKATAAIKDMNKDIRVLALTMLDDEITLVKLLRAGVNGYLNKDIEPDELRTAIRSLADDGYYYTEHVAGKLVNVIINPVSPNQGNQSFSDQELKFIEFCCSDDTYQMIADKMILSIKTIDGYRAKLFDKLGVKSRVGLVLYALKNNIVSLDQIDL